MKSLSEMTIMELRAYIEWRKEEQKKLYLNWNQLSEEERKKYDRYQNQMVAAVNEINKRKEARKQ